MTRSDNNSNDGHFLGNFLAKLAHGFSPSVMDRESCQIGYEGSDGVSINIENLNKSFGENHVLKDINLVIEPGETFFRS